MNSLSGFSTAGNFTIPLDGTVDLRTVTPETLLVLEQPSGAVAPVTTTVDSGGRLIVTPFVALKPDTDYLVVLTSGVIGESQRPLISSPILELTKSTRPLADGSGTTTVPGLSSTQLQTLETIRQRLQPVWEAAEQATGQNRSDIPLALTFHTQPLFSTLQYIRDTAHSRPASDFAPSITLSYTTEQEIDNFYKSSTYNRGLNVFSEVPEHDNVGAIYIGTIRAPWYIVDDTERGFIGSGSNVRIAEYRDLEFLAILPKGAGPFPSLIFQHGYARTKMDMGGLANFACGQGRAVIGVDLVVHGTNAPPPQIASLNGIDFFNQDKLTLLRDNLRQSVANLCYVNKMIVSGATDFDQNNEPDLVQGLTAYVGHSEGAIVGGVFGPLESDNRSAVINAGSGPFMSSIQVNAGFGPEFDQNLKVFGGIDPDTAEYRAYYFIAQTLVDDGDSFNYLPHAIDGSLRDGRAAGDTLLIDMFEVLDLPAKVAIVASQGQARALGGPQVSPLQVWPGLEAVTAPYLGSGEYQYRGGGHFWLLDPAEGPPNGATTEAARRQALLFIETAETGIGEIIDVFRGPDAPLTQ